MLCELAYLSFILFSPPCAISLRSPESSESSLMGKIHVFFCLLSSSNLISSQKEDLKSLMWDDKKSASQCISNKTYSLWIGKRIKALPSSQQCIYNKVLHWLEAYVLIYNLLSTASYSKLSEKQFLPCKEGTDLSHHTQHNHTSDTVAFCETTSTPNRKWHNSEHAYRSWKQGL